MNKSYFVYRENQIVADDIRLADSFCKRLLGLLPVKSLEDGSGLLISPCRQVHTFFMKFPIDVIFIDKEYKIIDIERNLVPGRITKYYKSSHMVLEMKSGAAAEYKLNTDEVLKFVPDKNLSLKKAFKKEVLS